MKNAKWMMAVLMMLAMLLGSASIALAEVAPETQIEETEGAQEELPEVKISMKNEGEIYFGDKVTLKADVESIKEINYKLQWQVNKGNGWKKIKNQTDDTYTFTVSEKNCEYAWRVVLITK